MYRVCVRQKFIAQHFLIGGDWGEENYPHSHFFHLELELAGKDLDQHGYLFDIAIIKEHMNQILSQFKDRLLNDIPEFAGMNPSVENFCRIISNKMIESIEFKSIQSLVIRLWEDEEAWASFETQFP